MHPCTNPSPGEKTREVEHPLVARQRAEALAVLRVLQVHCAVLRGHEQCVASAAVKHRLSGPTSQGIRVHMSLFLHAEALAGLRAPELRTAAPRGCEQDITTVAVNHQVNTCAISKISDALESVRRHSPVSALTDPTQVTGSRDPGPRSQGPRALDPGTQGPRARDQGTEGQGHKDAGPRTQGRRAKDPWT